METIRKILIALVAVAHLYFLWMEMFAWQTSGKKAFKDVIPDEMFMKTKVMAANQGLYNGFLAAGLIWTLFIKDVIWSENISLFFLGCVIIAGIYGAITISKKIFFIQSIPALIAVLFLLLS